jgi:hypothetical protein
MVDEDAVVPEYEQLGIPVDTGAEPEDAGPDHNHDQLEDDE